LHQNLTTTKITSSREDRVTDAWTEIVAAEHPGVDNVRLADPTHPLDFHRGRDFQGHYNFSLTAKTDHDAVPGLPRLSGIDTAMVDANDGLSRLVLTLRDSGEVDLFSALCTNLMLATRGLERGQNAKGIPIVINRLVRWQELIKKRRDNVLSRSSVIGLFGELTFLMDFLVPLIGPVDSVFSWRGPFSDEQDFAAADWIVEVKTQMSTADQRLQIASEHQLDTSSGRILVSHQTLSTAITPDPASHTLNSIVDEVMKIVRSASHVALDAFNAALVEAGYRLRPEYDDPAWVVSRRSFYEVTDAFPRIVPAGLMGGVQKVRYTVAIESCADCAVTEQQAKECLSDA